MLELTKLWNRPGSTGRFQISRPIVLLQSDDWGRVGVRDAEGAEQLRASGIELGEQPYDFYTLETADDLMALRDVLKRHRDSSGRPACLVMNFILANLDFARMAAEGFKRIHLRLLSEGLPGHWSRPGLLQAYREGIADGVLYPALHGLTHFHQPSVEKALSQGGERGVLLQKLWRAETPYIYWRMPWIGYECCSPEKSPGFLSAAAQVELVGRSAEAFRDFFRCSPLSACAPGYRANRDTHAAWAKCGLRVAQNGSGEKSPPFLDASEILNLQRTIDFEPSSRELPLETCMQLAEDSFAEGAPAIVSIHAINFHSSLKDFRGPTLRGLDRFLSALERKYPDLLYLHDADMYQLVTEGRYRSSEGFISVEVRRQGKAKSGSAAWSWK